MKRNTAELRDLIDEASEKGAAVDDSSPAPPAVATAIENVELGDEVHGDQEVDDGYEVGVNGADSEQEEKEP